MNLVRLLLVSFTVLFSGCAHYTTPGGSVSLNDLAEQDINKMMSTKPLANFPANLAIARIQASGYQSYRQSSFGHGRYSVVTVREIESEQDFLRMIKLEGIAGIAPLNKLFLPTKLDSIKALRLAAARLKTDILMIYTFDTSFNVGKQSFMPLSVISLGFMNNKEVSVTTTATAAFFDVRTEYLYGIAEATAKYKDNASVWSSESVVDDLRVLTEKEAFQGLLTEIETTWKGITSMVQQVSKISLTGTDMKLD